MNIFIFRNQTIEPFFGGKDVAFSGYDDISVIPEDANRYIWLYLVPPGISSKVACEVDTYIEKLEIVLSQVSSTKQFIVFNLCSLANTNIISSDTSLLKSIEKFNSRVLDLSLQHNNIRIVDFSEFTSHYTTEQLVNWKFYFLSQALLNLKLAKDFEQWWQRKENEFALKRKKCLVLDLDNTLWGGILGEDGIAGIKIGGDYPGKSFACWQNALLDLSHAGVMLTVCSKNNESDVLEAWDKNPFMILKKDDFVSWRINWQDKATNIRELAEELNIGLDSMVFIDDNPTERELIKQLLPMVEVPEFPEKPYLLMSFFDDVVNKYFRVYSITDEDKSKTKQYKANAKRAAEQKKFHDFNDYLRSLEINIKILSLDEFILPRIAQMTQKTNQFNLTTYRYTENDIQQLAKDGCMVYAISVSDKFGDNGITGEIILRSENNATIIIDTLLLSCRILGKGIEFAFLDSILNMLYKKGYKTVKAKYIKTAKNIQVAEFYERAGFNLVYTNDNVKEYTLSINKRKVKDFYTISL